MRNIITLLETELCVNCVAIFILSSYRAVNSTGGLKGPMAELCAGNYMRRGNRCGGKNVQLLDDKHGGAYSVCIGANT